MSRHPVLIDEPGKRILLMGNEAIVGGAVEVGVDVATALAEEAGDPTTTNVVVLGALMASGKLPFGEETVVKVLRESLRPAYFEINRRAFELGKEGYEKSLGK